MRVLAVGLALALGATVLGFFGDWQGQPLAGATAGIGSASPPVDQYAFSWSGSASAIAFEVALDVSQVSDCEVRFSAAGLTTAAGGPEFVKLVRTDTSRSTSVLTDDGAAQVHVEGVADTRGTIVQTDGVHWALDAKHRRPQTQGTLSLFFAATRMAPWPTHEVTGADALRLTIECSAPFSVASERLANGIVLANDRSLADGATVHVGGLGSVVRGDQVERALSSEFAALMVGQSGNEGTLGLRGPEGLREVDLARAERFYEVRQGQGPYGVGLDCVCRGALWLVMADLVDDPGFGRLGATV